MDAKGLGGFHRGRLRGTVEGVTDRERLLSEHARAQQGLFTLEQARACGFSASTVAARAESGMYEIVHPGVYGVAGAGPSWQRDVLAAVLSGPTAASHQTAAYLIGLTTRKPDEIETVSMRHLRVRRNSFVVHESKDLVDSDIVRVGGIPVTSAVRTVVDLGANAPSWLVESCLDAGLRRGDFTAWDVRRFIARVARPGRTGIGRIRPLVEERLEWGDVTESVLEDTFRSVVVSAALPIPLPQHVITDDLGTFVGRFDFAYPEKRVLIELDSEAHHMDRAAFQRDREKQNAAQVLGWTVYRFTWRQIIDQPARVIRTLASIRAK